MNKYTSLRDAPEFDALAGDIIELDLTEEQESDLLAAKRLEIEPREYKVIGTSRVFETDPDGTFEAALPVGREAQLVAGGHIERVDKAAKKTEGK